MEELEILSVSLYFNNTQRYFITGKEGVTRIEEDGCIVMIWMNDKLKGKYYGVPYSLEYK